MQCLRGSMLMISRRVGERIVIGNEIEITITEVHRRGVRVAIRAPRGMAVVRGEVRDAIAAANQAAASASLPPEALEALVESRPAAAPSGPVEEKIEAEARS